MADDLKRAMAWALKQRTEWKSLTKSKFKKGARLKWSPARDDFYVPMRYLRADAQRGSPVYEKMACSAGAYSAASRFGTPVDASCGKGYMGRRTKDGKLRQYRLLGLWRGILQGKTENIKYFRNPTDYAFIYEDMGDHVDWGVVDPRTDELLVDGRASDITSAFVDAHAAMRSLAKGGKKRRGPKVGGKGSKKQRMAAIKDLI